MTRFSEVGELVRPFSGVTIPSVSQLRAERFLVCLSFLGKFLFGWPLDNGKHTDQSDEIKI